MASSWHISLLMSLLFFQILETQYFDYNQCVFSFNDNGINITYNFTLMNLYDTAFEVDDFPENTYYVFHICGGIPRKYWNETIPASCEYANTKTGPCLVISKTQCLKYYTITNQLPSALQISVDGKSCYWLGMEINQPASTIYNASNYSVELYDPSNSVAGIKFTILNGALCKAVSPYRNRALTVELLCPISYDAYFTPEIEVQKILNETVLEHPTCDYIVTLTTPLACPTECIVADETSPDLYSICNSRGVCAADPVANRVRCLCYVGWTGDTCNEVDPTSNVTQQTTSSPIVTQQTTSASIVMQQTTSSSISIVTIICIVLLGLALIIILALCYQVGKYKELLINKEKAYVHPIPDAFADDDHNDDSLPHDDENANLNTNVNKNETQMYEETISNQ